MSTRNGSKAEVVVITGASAALAALPLGHSHAQAHALDSWREGRMVGRGPG